jgi:menaquinone-dependent protoporphyrinogen oxidase
VTRIAILYGTTEGQTAKIAHHMGARAKEHGCAADVFHVAELPKGFDVASYDGVLLGASIHEGRHQRYVVKWVKAQRAALERIPSAWFTVCLGIESKHPDERAEAASFPKQLSEQTGFRPGASTVFAGALMYTKYSWLKRMVLKQIAKHSGGSTDTSHDHEYTDWAKVDAYVDALLERAESAQARSKPSRRQPSRAAAS